MAWEPSWQDLEEVENLIERDLKEKPPDAVNSEGFKILSLKERMQRAVAMIVFIMMFPFVVLFLGIYRLISLFSFGKSKSE